MTLGVHRLDCPRLKSAARRAGMVAATAALATVAAPQGAIADGDPASDVLIGQNAFVPWDADATPARQAQLMAVLGAAARSGYPIRVAVIASQSDLGSVTALWRQPERYARFLDQELSLTFTGPVLTVMPDGVGLASATPLSASERGAIGAVAAAPIARSRLATVAQVAVEKLAAAAGHPLPSAVMTATIPPTTSSTSTGTVAYVVLALGAVLIAGAWAASLRARPWRRLARRRASG